jgi:hypothetical protein
MDRVATVEWKEQASKLCEDENLDSICPNMCKQAGRTVPGCTTLLSSAYDCSYLGQTSFKESVEYLRGIDDASWDNAHLAQMSSYHFEHEGPGPRNAQRYKDRHCMFLDTDARDGDVPAGNFVTAKGHCTDYRARLCQASEVEAAYNAGSTWDSPDSFWTQTTDRVASGESCPDGQVVVVKNEGTVLVMTCRPKEESVAKRGLCCGDDTVFIVT